MRATWQEKVWSHMHLWGTPSLVSWQRWHKMTGHLGRLFVSALQSVGERVGWFWWLWWAFPSSYSKKVSGRMLHGLESVLRMNIRHCEDLWRLDLMRLYFFFYFGGKCFITSSVIMTQKSISTSSSEKQCGSNMEGAENKLFLQALRKGSSLRRSVNDFQDHFCNLLCL